VNSPAKTFGVSSWFLFSNTYQPQPAGAGAHAETPTRRRISVRQANAQPIFKPVRMLGSAAGIRIFET